MQEKMKQDTIIASVPGNVVPKEVYLILCFKNVRFSGSGRWGNMSDSERGKE